MNYPIFFIFETVAILIMLAIILAMVAAGWNSDWEIINRKKLEKLIKKRRLLNRKIFLLKRKLNLK